MGWVWRFIFHYEEINLPLSSCILENTPGCIICPWIHSSAEDIIWKRWTWMNGWGKGFFGWWFCITNIMWWCFLTWRGVSVCFISSSVLELNRGHFEFSLTLLDDTNCTSDRFSAADSGRLFSQVIMKLRSKDLHLSSSFSTKNETIFYLVRINWPLV